MSRGGSRRSPATTPMATPEDEEACGSRDPGGPGRHPHWSDLLAGVSSPDQLIVAAAPPTDAEQVLQGARRCGRRFMRVFSDNLHNCYVDWLDSKHMMELRARALKRRILRGPRKHGGDNELYRSNSFKFERFERKDDPSDKQVALCDDYSLPVDFVNKRRPVSACDPGQLRQLGQLLGQASIELLDTYCDPRDSKAYLVPGEEAKVYTSPDREYTHPYADGTRAGARFCKATKAAKVAARAAAAAVAAAAAGEQQQQQEEEPVPSAPPVEDDGAYEDVIVRELQQLQQQQLEETPQGAQGARCPYYYADLLLPPRGPPREHRRRTADRYRKCASVDSAPPPQQPEEEEAGQASCPAPRRPARGWSEDVGMSPSLDLDDMSRRLHLYETAFDSRVAAPADPRDEDVTHRAILAVSPSAAALAALAAQQDGTPGLTASSNTLSTALCGSRCGSLCGAMTGLHLGASTITNPTVTSRSSGSGGSGSDSPLRDYSPPPPGSAPASAPLPAKFHGASRALLSIRSAPHLAAKPVREIKGRPTSLLSDTTDSNKDSLGRPCRTKAIQEIKGRPERPMSLVAPRRPKFSSTESMATSSSGGSLESVRSSTSEGERSSSSDGRPGSSSLSSHSEDSAGPLGGSSGNSRLYGHHNSAKLHILSPISDKSSLEPCSETSDNNRNNNSERASPEPGLVGESTPTGNTPAATPTGTTTTITTTTTNLTDSTNSKSRRRTLNNRNLITLSLHGTKSVEGEVPGSDSGISVDGNLRWANNQQDVEHLPFDMPKLRRRRANMILDTATSSSATSVEAGSAGSGGVGHEDLPFDMPKLRRKLRAASSESSSTSQSSDPPLLLQDLPFDMPKLRKKQLSRSSESSCTSQSDPSVSTGVGAGSGGRPSLSLNLAGGQPGHGPFSGCSSLGAGPADGFGSGVGSAFAPARGFRDLGLGSLGRPGLSLSFNSTNAPSAHIDTTVPLERQGWYLGAISRLEAERLLRQAGEGSYLVRNSESTRQDFSLSLKSARGFMHMRIQKDENGRFILGQFSRPFESVPEMIRHFSVNRLPIRGAEHMCLLHPVIQPLL